MHRTKQRGEKAAALTEKQSDVVQTSTSAAPKEVRDTLRKPSTAHSTSKWRLKLQGHSALQETDPLEPDHYVLSCQVSPD